MAQTQATSDRRRPPRRTLWIALAVAAVVLATACNETKHYELLSFLFDGVPVPPHLQKPGEDEQGVPIEAGGGATTAGQEDDKAVTWFYHTPYANRDCFGCHDRRLGFQATLADASLCQRCHPSYSELGAEDWLHGPLGVESCGLCHLAHKSEHEFVLNERQPGLCLQCHDEQQVSQLPYHADLDFEQQRCSSCHDPHQAGNRLLLVDSRTYTRRRRTLRPVESPHADWTRDDCTRCHLVEQSNKLLDNVEQTCLTCHAAVKEESADHPLHDPVRKDQCLVCHTPHRSLRPHMIRSGVERICTGCHDVTTQPIEAHPSMLRGDCLLCHNGHGSDRPKYLKPGVALPLAQPLQTPDDTEPIGDPS